MRQQLGILEGTVDADGDERLELLSGRKKKEKISTGRQNGLNMAVCVYVCTVRRHAVMRSRGAICWCVSLPVSAVRVGMKPSRNINCGGRAFLVCASACIKCFFLFLWN